MNSIKIKSEDGSFIEIYIIEREFDGDWINGSVRASIGKFKCEFDFTLMTHDIYSFRDQLEILNKHLSGNAEFSPIERQLNFTMTCENLGRIKVFGSLRDSVVSHNQLDFQFYNDQSYLIEILNDIHEIEVLLQ